MDEQAVTLKYLEVRATKQGAELSQLTDKGASLLASAARARADGAKLVALLGLERGVVARREPRIIATPVVAPTTTGNWSALCDGAALALETEGIEPSCVRLPASAHRLDAIDIAAALTFGALGALTPSLGSRRGLVGDAFREIQRAADSDRLPGVVQAVFGRHPAPFMDAGASGVYHRFCDGHDLLSAVPAGVANLGCIRGPLQVFQHLLTDSFGATGIPLPGSDALGSAIARIAGVSSINDLVSPRDLSRYASLRMSDGVAAGATSLLLRLYVNGRTIPEGSMRRQKLGVLAHGLCLLGIAATAAIPGMGHLVPFRSHVNYMSLAALVKNAWAWQGLVAKLVEQNDTDFERLRGSIAKLEACRVNTRPDSFHRELAIAAHLVGNA
jgi:hypothetical protein